MTYCQSSAFPLIIKLKIQYIQRLQYYVKVISELLGLKDRNSVLSFLV